MRRTPASLLALTLLATGAPAAFLAGPAAAVAPGDPSVTGFFAAPFQEPGERCTEKDGERQCKPAAGSIATLPNGKIVYWDALDSIQEADYNATLEFGNNARNDMARVLDLRSGSPVFQKSDPNTSVDPKGNDGKEFLPGPLNNNDEKRNDGDLFCSSQIFLANGDIIDVGGTAYYQEPGVPGQPTYGVVELEGLKNSRIYDTDANTWRASGQMKYGRWYPSVLTLPDGKVAAFSGVTKLIKPVYQDRPSDSGRNVTQSEVYDPKTGKWTVDGGNKSLPLYPRLHLLPNGKVYYDGAGQTFNPAGQAYDEATWNMASSYDPKTKTWSDLGLPEFGNGLKGFRGSAFSQMLPLKPNAQGQYDTVDVLSAGGVYGVTPGTFVGTDTSTLNTLKIGADGKEAFSSKTTGKLNTPRWYSTGVGLPTGEVIAFSGADRDEVIAPGFGKPVTEPEMYDPRTGTWTKLASQSRGRTYHNTATLLPDGRVLVGGHAPIATGYGKSTNTFEQAAGFSNPDRDPSFEIFSPPNLFYGQRPVIQNVQAGVERGRTLKIATPDGAGISSVTLVRNTAMTHLVDADQRTVVLPVVDRSADSVTVSVTDNAAVLPNGPYNLFINKKYAKGETPSVGRQVFVGTVPAELADDVNSNNSAASAKEMAQRGQSAKAAKGNNGKGKKKGQKDGKGGNGAAPVAVAAAAPVARPVAATPVDTDLRASSSPWTSPLPLAALALSSLTGVALVLRRRSSAR